MLPAFPSFPLAAARPVSAALRLCSVATFAEAVDFVAALPYGRNPDKEDPLAVLSDACGTCSTKHALLKRLADENQQPGWQLCLGIFRMHAGNTPPAAPVLACHGLAYLPEAHCYLRHRGAILDATTPAARPARFAAELLAETELTPAEIGAEKIRQHQAYLAAWLPQQPQLRLTLPELWAVREACIAALAGR